MSDPILSLEDVGRVHGSGPRAVRALGHILAGVSLGLGWLWLYITPDRRSWPDLISRTVIVRA